MFNSNDSRTPAMTAMLIGLPVVAVISAYMIGAGQTLGPPATPPFSDYRSEKPGVQHHITPADLPAPFATDAASNAPKVVPRPSGAMPQTLPGYTVSLYSDELDAPRLIRAAPNGDLFVAETGRDRVRVLRGADAAGKAQEVEVFAAGLNKPFGIAFYPLGPDPQYVYVGNTDSIVRFPYRSGDLKARGPFEGLVKGQFPGGGHSTRDVAFTKDGRKMYVGVGSRSNVDDPDTTP